MDYIARTVPPRLLADTAVRFDTEIFEAVVDILSPTGAIYPRTEQSCLERAKRIAHLPYRSGGLNLIQLAQRSPMAFYGCSLQISGDPLISVRRDELVADLIDCYEHITALLSTDVLKPGHALAPVLPPYIRETA
jgi:hypothetical protein